VNVKIELPNSIAELTAELLRDFLVKADVDHDYVGAKYFRELIEAFETERVIIIGVRDRDVV
jgi:hypothetical protein